MWFIIGIIIFLITLYVHKHTYRISYCNKTVNIPTPMWFIIVTSFVSIIPVVNIIVFIFGLVIYIVAYINEDIQFKATGVMRKLIDFLNKEV